MNFILKGVNKTRKFIRDNPDLLLVLKLYQEGSG